jgi:thymidylate synthase
LPEAYHNALEAMYEETFDDKGNLIDENLVDVPDYNIKQIECSMTVYVKHPLEEPRISRFMYGGHKELMEYLLEMIDGIADPLIGKTDSYPYTYHDRFAKYIKPCIIDELERNPQSRRAIISLRDNDRDVSSGDPPCLQSIQCFIRKGYLDMAVTFRSNDLVKAFFFNAFALVRLQEIIAEQLNIPVGTYSHRSASMHVYERDFDKLKGIVKRIGYDNFYNNGNGLTYNYEDYYKELMVEEVPNILEQIDSLKEKYLVE